MKTAIFLYSLIILFFGSHPVICTLFFIFLCKSFLYIISYLIISAIILSSCELIKSLIKKEPYQKTVEKFFKHYIALPIIYTTTLMAFSGISTLGIEKFILIIQSISGIPVLIDLIILILFTIITITYLYNLYSKENKLQELQDTCYSMSEGGFIMLALVCAIIIAPICQEKSEIQEQKQLELNTKHSHIPLRKKHDITLQTIVDRES